MTDERVIELLSELLVEIEGDRLSVYSEVIEAAIRKIAHRELLLQAIDRGKDTLNNVAEYLLEHKDILSENHFRDCTKEENDAINKYIDEHSVYTGINIKDF